MKKCLAALVMIILLQAPCAVLADENRNRVHESAEQVNPLLPGMKAPSFRLRDAAGAEVVFNPDALTKPLVMTFYRGGWCPFCNLHLSELRKAEAELREMGFDYWFISIDKPELLYESLETPGIDYRVLSDSETQATRAFGVAFRVSAETVERYREYGIDLEAASGRDHHVLPAPSTFLIGKDGIIRFQYTNPDYTLRLHPDVLMAAAKTYLADAELRLRQEYREREAGE